MSIDRPPVPDSDVHRAIDTQWLIYDAINEWIRFADAKAGALLATNGVVAVAALGAIKENAALFADHRLLWWTSLLGVFGLGVSAFFCLDCIRPRTRAGGPKSLIYFDHIAGHEDADAYASEARALSNHERAFAEVSRQVWINARVAQTKHRR